MNRRTSTSTSRYPKGCFVDEDGFVRDVANLGLSCQVTDRTVMLCGPYVEGDGAEVLGEFTFYPTLDASEPLAMRRESTVRPHRYRLSKYERIAHRCTSAIDGMVSSNIRIQGRTFRVR